MKDNRDPKLLGEALLKLQWHRSIHLTEIADGGHPSLNCVDYPDETTIQKYGRPQELPSTLPN